MSIGLLGFDILWNHIVVPYISGHWGDVKAWMCTCKRMYDAIQNSTLLPPRFSACNTNEELALVTRTTLTSSLSCSTTCHDYVVKAVAKQVFALYGVDFERELGNLKFPSGMDGACSIYREPYCYVRSDCYWWRDDNFYAKGKLLEKMYPMIFYLQVIKTPDGEPLWMISKETTDMHRGFVMILHIFLPNDMMKYDRPPNKRRCAKAILHDSAKQVERWTKRKEFYENGKKSFQEIIKLEFKK
jgi:hypothetical protein